MEEDNSDIKEVIKSYFELEKNIQTDPDGALGQMAGKYPALKMALREIKDQGRIGTFKEIYRKMLHEND